MSKYEKDLSEYIDTLNDEKKPIEHVKAVKSTELQELMDTVRLVKSLKEPALPDMNYPQKVVREIGCKLPQKTSSKKSKQAWFVGFGTVAAAVILILIMNLSFGRNNIVYAMEQAFQEVKTYHGVLEIIESDEAGVNTIQAKREVWASKEGHYYIKELEGSQKGLITINNGEMKWQIRPDSKQIYLFPAFPDPYRFTFELGKEVENVKNAIETKVIGEEAVSGRMATILEVTPQGGASYKLWIDKETKLPLKKQSAMQNALKYTVSYVNIDFNEAIPAELIAYNLPAGFEEINTNREQLVSSLEEAEEMAGFEIRLPKAIAADYIKSDIAVQLDEKVIKLYYLNKNKQNRVVVLQGKAKAELKPASNATLGKVGNSIAEIQSPIVENSGVLTGGAAYAGVTNISAIRWQEDGFEYAIIGDGTIEDLGKLIESMTNKIVQIPQGNTETPSKPQIEAPVDLEIEQNEQKSVDAGHSPWRLDPVFVAQVFISLKISPEGIVGEYPIAYEAFKVLQNTGNDAVLGVSTDETPISKIYLKKLIRQDSTGIWTVVGYDQTK